MSAEQLAELASVVPAENTLDALLRGYAPGGPQFENVEHLQRTLTRLVESTAAMRYRNSDLSMTSYALVTANAAKWANAWLVAIPSEEKPWLFLPDIHCRIAMRMRLGLPPHPAPNVNCICSQANLSVSPAHPLHCRHCGEFSTFRHDCVKQLLAYLAQSFGANACIEPRHVQYSDNRHPDVGFVFGSRQITTDVTVRHPLAPSYVRNLAQEPLGVAISAEREKVALYEAEAKAQGVKFVPFALETTGGWGPSAVALVKQLADHAEAFTLFSRTEALVTLVQGVSMAVQRGNAQLLVGSYQLAASRAETFFVTLNSGRREVGRRTQRRRHSASAALVGRPA
jgi:hypothetical protein